MKTTILLLVTALVTCAHALGVQDDQQFDAAQKLKPARVTSSERIAPAGEPGTPFLVRATLLDPTGKPAAGVQVFAYQTDRTGIYAAPGAADPWRLKGWAVTDAQGKFEFRTIRPGLVSRRRRGGAHPPDLHDRVAAAGRSARWCSTTIR